MNFLNNIFLIVCGVLQFFAIAFVWLYVMEMRQGCAPDGYDAYKYHWQFLFWASVIIEIILWLTITELQPKIVVMFIISLVAWLISSIVFFVLSVGKMLESDLKHNTRLIVRLAVTNVLIFGIISWLLYI